MDFFWPLLINEKFSILSIKILIILRKLELMAYIRLLQSYEVYGCSLCQSVMD